MVIREVNFAVSAQKLPKLIFGTKDLLDIAGVPVLRHEIFFVVDPIYKFQSIKKALLGLIA